MDRPKQYYDLAGNLLLLAFMSRLLVKSIFGRFPAPSLFHNFENIFEFRISGGAQQFK